MAPGIKSDAPISYDVNLPYKPVKNDVAKPRTEFPQYLPSWDDKEFYDEIGEFDFEDPASRANQLLPNLRRPGIVMTDITPKMGTIISGLKLEDIDDKTKDEIALLISVRKVVAFRDQMSFLRTGPGVQQDFMKHFGEPNIQPVTGSVKGYPGFHIIHRDNNQDEIEAFLAQKTTSCLWHQDVSYEPQPPGYIMLGILACPEVGGDTIFADTCEAYRRLSPGFQAMIDPLFVRHSSANMINHVRAVGGHVRRDPVESVHPIVRVHPVTGEKSLWVNGEFTTGVVDFKPEESEWLIKKLVDHVIMGHDFQARVSWERGSVVMFDGRNTLHTATVDYDSRIRARHIFRLASMTEKPIPAPEQPRSLR